MEEPALFAGEDSLTTSVAAHRAGRVVLLRNEDGDHSLDAAMRQAAEDFTATPSPAYDVAYFQLSGRTTGTPKLLPRPPTAYYSHLPRNQSVCCLNECRALL